LAFGLKLRGVARGIIAGRVAGIADMLGIGELLARKPAQLSGGQRQRVALGRALVREPKAFLLDEPLSNLDAKLRASMRTELIKLHRSLGTTIVHVTHDQVEAMTMGERICIMKDGVIVQVGAPMEVYRSPANTFVAGFLASPPMNLLRGTISADAVSLGAVKLALPPSVRAAFAIHPDSEVIVGLRPEDFHLKREAARIAVPVEIKAIATEVLGPEVILVGTLAHEERAEIHIRCPRDFRAAPGTLTVFHYDLSELQLFDAKTTNALKRSVEI
jgi:multiple sugar transport system ATP-binding protein